MNEPFSSLFGNPIIYPDRGRVVFPPIYSSRERELMRGRQIQQRKSAAFCPSCEHCRKVEQERIEEFKRLSELEQQKKEDYERRCREWVGKLKRLRKKRRAKYASS